jgi:hypothetical protein
MRSATVTVSLLAHALVLLVILLAPVKTPVFPPEWRAVEVELVEPLPPPPEPEPAEKEVGGGQPAASPTPEPKPAPSPSPVKAPTKAAPAPVARPIPRPSRPAPRSPTVEPVPITAPEPSVSYVFLGDSALAGAMTAGGGAGAGSGAGTGAGTGSGAGSGSGSGSGRGGVCNMVERLQNALRDDPRIRARLTEAYQSSGARGRAIVIWNGDWVLSPGQDGKGLAGVRQAVAVVVGFSPRECKSQTVRGYVVVTLSDDPGAPKLALGTGQWRWSDLLGL